jgi:hypothetical protein
MARKRTKPKAVEPAPEPEGPYFSPRHRFNVYKAIRASVALSPGAKVAWEALVERLWEGQTSVERTYDKLGRDVGLSRDQAKRYARELERAGLLEIRARFRDNRQMSNEVFFLWRELEEIRTGDLGLSRQARGGLRRERADAPANTHPCQLLTCPGGDAILPGGSGQECPPGPDQKSPS